jgi:hypothetical protein
MATYATFECINYRSWENSSEEPSDELTAKLTDDCAVPFSELLPVLYIDLPACPYCGGPSRLLELLEPVAG